MYRPSLHRIAVQGLAAVGIILSLLLAGGAPSDFTTRKTSSGPVSK